MFLEYWKHISMTCNVQGRLAIPGNLGSTIGHRNVFMFLSFSGPSAFANFAPSPTFATFLQLPTAFQEFLDEHPGGPDVVTALAGKERGGHHESGAHEGDWGIIDVVNVVIVISFF